MLRKLAALFAVAVTLPRPLQAGALTGSTKAAPTKATFCAIVEPDGPCYDVYIASIEAGVYVPPTTSLAPLPWISQPTEAAALKMVAQYCSEK